MISIIIPIYNTSEYLEECIKSIINQTYKDFEIILINDGSTDNSLSICQYYESHDNRIRLLNQKNSGVSKTRNHGLNYVQGEWVLFVDSDDYILPNALETMFNLAQQNMSDIILCNAYKLCNGKYQSLFKLSNETKPIKVVDIKHFALWGYLFKVKIIKNNNIKFIDNLAYSEDLLFITNIIPFCKNITYCNSHVYVYRVNPTSACNSINSKKIYHQIYAANQLISLTKEYYEDKQDSNYLIHKISELIKCGIYAYWEQSPNNRHIKSLYTMYKKNIGTSTILKIKFYKYYIYTYLIYIKNKFKIL